MRMTFLKPLLAAALLASPLAAQAATSSQTLTLNPVGPVYLGVFGNGNPDGGLTGTGYTSFTDTYSFTLPAGVAGGSANAAVGTFGFSFLRSNVDFTSVTLNGQTFSNIFENVLGADLQSLVNATLVAGTQTLTVNGRSQRNGSYAGEVTFVPQAISAAPEPETWAMLIIGFGAVGVSMRSARRKRMPRMAMAV